MLLESSQLLNSNRPELKLMKPAFMRHPSTLWVGSSIHNYAWLWSHLAALHLEYTFRYNKIHSLLWQLEYLTPPPGANYTQATGFPKLTRDLKRGLDFTFVDDTFESYRMYLRGKWSTDSRPVCWTKRGSPIWAKQ